MFGEFQMIGDSILCRFGEHILNLKREFKSNGKRGIGFCVGGQTIEELRISVEEDGEKLEKKVVVLVGTNDMLRRSLVCEMKWKIDVLLKFLREKCEEIIVLTLPPIPKLSNGDPYHFEKLAEYNDHLKNHDGVDKVRVVDITEAFTDPMMRNNCRMNLFEELIFFNGAHRPDFVHPNKEGLKVIEKLLKEGKDKKDKVVQSCTNQISFDVDVSEELLNEENFQSKGIRPVNQPLPEIKVRVGKIEISCLVDSGSQATILSEELFEELKKNSVEVIPELPVSNLLIVGITGVRSRRISKQVMIECEVEREKISLTCLVVMGISTELILGCDFFNEFGAKIDFEESRLVLRRDINRQLSIPFKYEDKGEFMKRIRLIRINKTNVYDTEDELELIKNNLGEKMNKEQQEKHDDVKDIITKDQLTQKIGMIKEVNKKKLIEEELGELEKILERIAVDLIGELPTGRGGCKYIFVLVDVFSKYVKLYPIKKATRKTQLNRIINNYLPEVGQIEIIVKRKERVLLWHKEMKRCPLS